MLCYKNSLPSVLVLLSTYNGEKYLRQQIDSILISKGVNVDILVRDDGSTDNTLSILNEYLNEGKLKWYIGSNVGPAMSFLQLIQDADIHDYYAFCDQDDLWENDKLFTAVNVLDLWDKKDIPALYFSALRTVDEHLNDIIITKKKSDYIFSLQQVMISNNATGCTIVFNNHLCRFLKMYKPKRVIMHDHWVYALCLAIDGYIFYDKMPHIKYRQHQSNTIGYKMTIRKRIANSSIKNGKCLRSMIAHELLENYHNFLSEGNYRFLFCCAYYRSNLYQKINLIRIITNYARFISKIKLIIEILLNLY